MLVIHRIQAAREGGDTALQLGVRRDELENELQAAEELLVFSRLSLQV